MEEQLTNTEVISALAYQVAIFAIFVCLMTDGIKKAIKMVMKKPKDYKLPQMVTLIMVAVGGFIYGFSGFNPAAGLAGAAIGGGVTAALDS